MRKVVISLASVFVIALTLSGCGGSDGGTASSGTTTPDTSTPTNEVSSSSMNEPDKVADLPPVPMIPQD